MGQFLRRSRFTHFFSHLRQRLVASVRPESINKPQVSALRALAVEIRVSDWQHDTTQLLEQSFSAADVVISAVNPQAVPDQTKLADAAQRVGVKRFIPSDFGPACVPGVRHLYDEVSTRLTTCVKVALTFYLNKKSKIRQYVKRSELPYTFVDVGCWYQHTIPPRNEMELSYVHEFYGDGTKNMAVVNLNNIGLFIGHIIADERTVNQYVFIYDDEKTLNEIYEKCSETAGEEFLKQKLLVFNDLFSETLRG